MKSHETCYSHGLGPYWQSLRGTDSGSWATKSSLDLQFSLFSALQQKMLLSLTSHRTPKCLHSAKSKTIQYI